MHGILYLTEEEGLIPAERELRELATNVQLFKDEQEYLVMRERVHRNTAESTNSRIKWWSSIQVVLIVLVCAFQVYFVKRYVKQLMQSIRGAAFYLAYPDGGATAAKTRSAYSPHDVSSCLAPSAPRAGRVTRQPGPGEKKVVHGCERACW